MPLTTKSITTVQKRFCEPRNSPTIAPSWSRRTLCPQCNILSMEVTRTFGCVVHRSFNICRIIRTPKRQIPSSFSMESSPWFKPSCRWVVDGTPSITPTTTIHHTLFHHTFFFPLPPYPLIQTNPLSHPSNTLLQHAKRQDTLCYMILVMNNLGTTPSLLPIALHVFSILTTFPLHICSNHPHVTLPLTLPSTSINPLLTHQPPFSLHVPLHHTPIVINTPTHPAPVFDGDMASFIIRAVIGMSGRLEVLSNLSNAIFFTDMLRSMSRLPR